MTKPTVSLVLGGGHSIGVPLAVAPKVSMIVPSASMTIHPVRMNGTVIAAPQTYSYFERIQERIVSFVAKNSHISRKKFLGLMLKTGEMAADVGSVLYGEEAVELSVLLGVPLRLEEQEPESLSLVQQEPLMAVAGVAARKADWATPWRASMTR